MCWFVIIVAFYNFSTGQKVFAVGYAFGENVPTTVFGHVHMVSFSIMTTTCDVRSGFSGGPVYTNNKDLLGLTVGKLSVGTVNFVLPSSEFLDTIEKYILTNSWYYNIAKLY